MGWIIFFRGDSKKIPKFVYLFLRICYDSVIVIHIIENTLLLGRSCVVDFSKVIGADLQKVPISQKYVNKSLKCWLEQSGSTCYIFPTMRHVMPMTIIFMSLFLELNTFGRFRYNKYITYIYSLIVLLLICIYCYACHLL